jgi:hypothetical protein
MSLMFKDVLPFLAFKANVLHEIKYSGRKPR